MLRENEVSLHMAVRKNDIEEVKRILANARQGLNPEQSKAAIKALVNQPFPEDDELPYNCSIECWQTPVNIAAQHNHEELVRLLIQEGADINYLPDFLRDQKKSIIKYDEEINFMPTVSWAIFRNNLALTRYLVQACKADLTQMAIAKSFGSQGWESMEYGQDHTRTTPLHASLFCACSSGKERAFEIVKCLLENGANATELWLAGYYEDEYWLMFTALEICFYYYSKKSTPELYPFIIVDPDDFGFPKNEINPEIPITYFKELSGLLIQYGAQRRATVFPYCQHFNCTNNAVTKREWNIKFHDFMETINEPIPSLQNLCLKTANRQLRVDGSFFNSPNWTSFHSSEESIGHSTKKRKIDEEVSPGIGVLKN